jgi:Zn-dependent protease
MTPPQRRKVIWFSTTEVKHLLIGGLLTLAIGFSMPLYEAPTLYGQPEVITGLAIIFAISFITHELAHKVTAQRHGLWAEFRVTMFGVLITLLSIISPIKIISPGAVMVGGAADRETIGKTSIAGPITNIALALLFLGLTQTVHSSDLLLVLYFGVLINSFIAVFNLIPFGIFDGFKVFSWNKAIWAIAFSASLVLTIYMYAGFPGL